MMLKAKYTTAGMTEGKVYQAINDDGCLIKDHLVKIVLDNGTVGKRLFSAFQVVED